MASMLTRCNFPGQASWSHVTNMVTPIRRNSKNVALRTVKVQRGNSSMSSDLLFSGTDTISTKSKHIDLVTFPPIQEKSHASTPAQENMITSRLHEDRHLGTSNCYPNSEMTNEELSVTFDLDNHDVILLSMDFQGKIS